MSQQSCKNRQTFVRGGGVGGGGMGVGEESLCPAPTIPTAVKFGDIEELYVG